MKLVCGMSTNDAMDIDEIEKQASSPASDPKAFEEEAGAVLKGSLAEDCMNVGRRNSSFPSSWRRLLSSLIGAESDGKRPGPIRNPCESRDEKPF